MKTYFLLLLLLMSGLSDAQSDDSRLNNYNINKMIAMEGFDPVSYFNGDPAKGRSNLNTTFKGITYYFISQKNLINFKLTPEKYEPAYGGWCAFAMGESGEKVKVDPETFTILDGRLYLFYNFWGNNTLTDWKKNEKTLKEAGDRNWMRIVR